MIGKIIGAVCPITLSSPLVYILKLLFPRLVIVTTISIDSHMVGLLKNFSRPISRISVPMPVSKGIWRRRRTMGNKTKMMIRILTLIRVRVRVRIRIRVRIRMKVLVRMILIWMRCMMMLWKSKIFIHLYLLFSFTVAPEIHTLVYAFMWHILCLCGRKFIP